MNKMLSWMSWHYRIYIPQHCVSSDAAYIIFFLFALCLLNWFVVCHIYLSCVHLPASLDVCHLIAHCFWCMGWNGQVSLTTDTYTLTLTDEYIWAHCPYTWLSSCTHSFYLNWVPKLSSFLGMSTESKQYLHHFVIPSGLNNFEIIISQEDR